MELNLDGKVALVLGGGGGLGRAVGSRLATEGASVALAGRSADSLNHTAAAIRADGGRCLTLPWDFSDTRPIDSNVSRIERELGPVSILVNITGGPPPTPAAGQGESTWLAFFRSMVLAVIAVTDRVLPGMREAAWGRVVTSTSSGVVAPITNLGLSNALRSSLLGWSKTLAGEVGRHGITVNVVVPGRIATDRVHELNEARAEREGRSVTDVEQTSIAAIPLGRFGEPREFGSVVAFLAGEPASYVTGSVIRVDGGLVASI